MSTVLKGRAKTVLAVSTIGLGVSVALASAAGAAVASAGPVTIVNPSTNQALSGPQSATQVFAANLPLAAACPGNTANNAYHVYSFMVPAGTDPSTVSFATGTPSTGLGYFGSAGYVGPINTATSGQVVGLPNDLAWSNYPGPSTDLTGGSTKTWDSGWACADGNGVVQRYWDQQITFAATSTSFTWTPIASVGAQTPEVPLTVALPLGGAAVLGGGAFVNRRRSRRGTPTAA